MKLKKGDTIIVTTGKDRGKTGIISRVVDGGKKVVVEGVNMYKKRVRPKRQGEKGQVVSVARSIDVSNACIVCGNCGKKTRIGVKINDGKKERFCKKCGTRI